MKYILYTRKSTEEDDRQVLSIEAQFVELKEFAVKEKLEIVASFQEAKTAKEPGRMKFAEMLAILEAGKADGKSHGTPIDWLAIRWTAGRLFIL